MLAEESRWIDACGTVHREELAHMCNISVAEIEELVDYGSLDTLQGGVFRADVVMPLREALRTRARYDLDLFTAGLLLQYLQRIRHLEGLLHSLRGTPLRPALRERPSAWREPHA